jgi:hypothetical protein
MKTLLAIAVISSATSVGCLAGDYYGSNFDQYFERSDTITLSAGDAKDVDAAIHVIDPWPRRSANRRIPANGARMIGAMQRYRSGQPTRADAPGGPPGATTGGAFNPSTAPGSNLNVPQ